MRVKPGQFAVLTGAASGIGLATATALAQRGLRIARLDVEAQALAATRRRVCDAARPGTDVIDLAVDIADTDMVARAAAHLVESLGPPDLLINNAGVVGPRRALWQQSADDFAWVLGVNLSGVVNGLRAFLPAMVDAGHGHVVNTASIAALIPIAGGGNAPYAASKAAIVALSRVLVEDLRTAGIGIGVSVLCPGPVTTNIRDAARNRPGLGTPAASSVTQSPSFTHAVAPVGPGRVAELVVEAIESERFWVLTNPGNDAEVVADLTAVAAAVRGTPAGVSAP